jgi:hypothetical protein
MPPTELLLKAALGIDPKKNIAYFEAGEDYSAVKVRNSYFAGK